MSQESTLKARRDVVGLTFTVIVFATEEMRNCWAITQLQQFLTRHFDINPWPDFRDLLQHMTEDITWNRQREVKHSATWREGSLRRFILEGGQLWQIAQNEGAWTFVIAPGVKVTATRSKDLRRSELGMDLTLYFDDPKLGSMVYDAFRDIRSVHQGFLAYVSKWEDVLYIQGAGRDDSVFTHGSKEKLGARVTRVSSSFDHYPVYRIAPLDGEQLVIYGDRDVTTDLHLHVPYTHSMVRHPDDNVVASVGPFSLSLKRDDPRGGRRQGRFVPPRDKIAVFHDQNLPIPVPNAAEDKGFDSADGDDEIEPRGPGEGWYPDEY